MLFVLVVILWVVLGVLLALRFRDDHDMSQFELTRLSGTGDQTARQLLEHQIKEPELESLRQIVVTIISTLLVTSSVFTFGLWGGVAMGAFLLIIAPLLVRIALIRVLADTLRNVSWPHLIRFTSYISEPLKWLRERNGASRQSRVYSQEELLDIVHHSRGLLSDDQSRRLKASLKFDERRVGDIMTPKSMIVTAHFHDTLGPLVMSELHKSGHSRFPVIEDDMDHVVGVLYLKELIDLKSEHQTVRDAMQKKVFYIREDQDLAHALHGFLKSHHHMFVVVNEYRETVGILTLEDAIEALIGSKIVDEFDEFDDLRAVAARNPRKNNRPTSHHDV